MIDRKEPLAIKRYARTSISTIIDWDMEDTYSSVQSINRYPRIFIKMFDRFHDVTSYINENEQTETHKEGKGKKDGYLQVCAGPTECDSGIVYESCLVSIPSLPSPTGAHSPISISVYSEHSISFPQSKEVRARV